MSRLTPRNFKYHDLDFMDSGMAEAMNKLAHYEDLEEAGRLIEVIRCRNCIRHDNSSSTEDLGWCDEYECITAGDDYCSRAVDKLAELKGGAE